MYYFDAFPNYFWNKYKHNYIFCINSGRSGSNYLAELINTANNAQAFHEPAPPMIGEYLAMVADKEYASTFSKRQIKLSGIRRLCKLLPENSVYVETNHMFIKTFFDIVSESLPNIKIIHLRRDIAETLKSFVELNFFSNRNPHWPNWMIRPDAVTRAIEIPVPYTEMDQFDRIIAYLIDIEARAIRYKRDYKDTPVIDVEVTQLSNIVFVESLFNKLGLDVSDATKDLCGMVVNDRSTRKILHNNPTNRTYCIQRVHEYLYKLAKADIPVPSTLLFRDS